LAMGWHVIFAWQACTTRMAIHKHVFMLALLHAQGRYASRAWLLFAASHRIASHRTARERERTYLRQTDKQTNRQTDKQTGQT